MAGSQLFSNPLNLLIIELSTLGQTESNQTYRTGMTQPKDFPLNTDIAHRSY